MRFFFLLFFLFPFLTYSQDIIIKTSGEKLDVNVERILENRVIYKKNDLGDTSKYSLSTVDIHKIKYRDGVEAVFNDLQTPSFPTPTSKPQIATNENYVPLIQSPISIDGKRYYIQDQVFSHKRVSMILKESTDKEVRLHLQKYRSAEGASKFLAFGSIPVGVFTYMCTALYFSETSMSNGYSPLATYFATAATVGGVVFLGMHVGNFYLRKVTRYQTLNKAIEAHNRSIKY